MNGLPGKGQYWGKYNEDKNCWHPLIHHCCDVALCCKSLFEQLPILRRRIARLGNLRDLSPVQIERLAALSALHDFGKFNHGFQNKIRDSKKNFRYRGHIKEAFSAFCYPKIQQRLIKALSLETIKEWFESDKILTQYILTILSHHGNPLNPNKIITVKHNWGIIEKVDPITGVEELRKAIYKWFPDAFEKTDKKEKLPSEPHFQHAFCGLIQLSDWIGSSENFFPFSNNINNDRFSFSSHESVSIISKMGIISSRYAEHIQPALPPFSRIVGKDWAPRALQKKIQQADNSEKEGSIICLEAETGSGKTEAAFLHFLKLFKEKKIDGMYFALPTRSAATQIYNRIHQMTINSFGEDAPPVVLAVPGYIIVDQMEGETGGTLPRFQVLWKDNEDERYRFRGWAAEHPKRYMAAPIIVGTIDQVLLSSLQVPHAHLRSTALLRHLIVVDEVHSSDHYMNTILLETLKNHIRAGGHAMLMSATLGAETRTMFINTDSNITAPSYKKAVNTPYPVYSTNTGKSERIERDNKSKQIFISILKHSYDNNETIAKEAFRQAENGATVIILRNKVNDALSTQKNLEEVAAEEDREDLLFRCSDKITPHHGRYHPSDRKMIDEALEKCFSAYGERKPCVVVTTQTVEQSLDVDFDYMITDLCPMDVLLQRAGRLHRHDIKRPHGFEKAQLKIIVPQTELISMLTDKGIVKPGTPAGMGTVYENMAILELTLEMLLNLEMIQIPEMNRELIESTVNPEKIEELIKTNPHTEKWSMHLRKLMGQMFARKAGGKISLIPRDKPFGEEVIFPGKADEKITTRLGQMDRIVEFNKDEERVYSVFGNHLTFMTIPAWMLDNTEIQGKETVDPYYENNGIRFSIADYDFIYNRFGLRKLG